MKTARGKRKAITLKPHAARIPLNPVKERARVMPPTGGGQEARERFARTFADVLSGRFGGSWAVEWEGANRVPPDSDARDSALPAVPEGRVGEGESPSSTTAR